MRKVFLTPLLICLSAQSANFAEIESQLKTLSPTIQRSQLNAEFAKSVKKESFAENFLPDIRSKIFSRKGDSFFNSPTTQNTASPTAYRQDGQYQNGINFDFNYSLFGQSRGFFDYKTATSEEHIQEKNYYAATIDQISSVAKLYLDYSRQVFQESILSLVLKDYKKVVSTTKQRYKNGLSTLSEYHRAEYRTLDIVNELESSRNQKRLTQIQINQYLGNQQDLLVIEPLKENILIKLVKFWNDLVPEESIAIKKAENHNDQLASAKYYLKKSTAQKNSQQALLLPRLTWESNYEYYKNNNLSFWDEDKSTQWSTLLKLEIPLFEGYSRFSQIGQAQIENQRALYQMKLVQLGIRSEIQRVIENSKFLAKKINRDLKQMQYSKRILEVSKSKYEKGTIILRNLIEDQNFFQRKTIELINTRVEFIKNTIDYLTLTHSGQSFSLANFFEGNLEDYGN